MQQAVLTRAKEIAEGLYRHEIEGVTFLLGRRRALLADDMGLGKTRQSVIAMVEAEAIRTLAQVLTGPDRSLYHIERSSQKGKFYTLEVIGVDITCDCPGFTHRGSCRHVHPLKSALAAEKPFPKGYKKILPD